MPLSCRFIAFVLLQLSIGGTNRAVSDLIENVLNNSAYNSKMRPLLNEGKPLDIFINININEISSISEVEMEYSMTCYLRQTWTDIRLAYSDYNKSVTLNHNQFDRIWTPDLFVRNLKSGLLHQTTVPNRLIRLSPDGTVLYSQRLSLTLSCNMVLDIFPMDNQTCYIEFGSYGYTMDDLIFYWFNNSQAVELDDRISLPEYEITGMTYEVCTKLFTSTGTFPCLKANFHFKRRLKAYILSMYLPSFLVVLLSWLSFWIDPESTPARTSLSILTILTITTQSSSLAKNSPVGSFTKASDVWMATCLVFVFAAFIEYSIVNTLSRKLRKSQSSTKKSTNGNSGLENDTELKKTIIATGLKDCVMDNISSDPAMAVEIASRICFPILFLIFNLIYWAYYLTRFSTK